MVCQETKDTREKLMEAAIRVFSREGFDGATVRDICLEAGANVAAVNYYFGSKEQLYRAILEMFFKRWKEFLDERRAKEEGLTPQERVESYIRKSFAWVFGLDPETGEYSDLKAELRKIFIMEVARPVSPETEEEIYRLLKEDTEAFRETIRDILGPDAPEDAVRDCDCSIIGQVLYYDTHWNLHMRINPDRPSMNDYMESLVEHVTRFSLAGLEATRNALG